MRTPRSLEALVEEHVRRWSLQRGRPPKRAPACVALSRLPGSGGASLGQAVAERLGYSFFGIEIVDRMAREGGVQRELVAGLDEQVRNTIDRYVLDALRPFREDDYLKQVVRSVTTLAERGGAVFLGRGANFFLPPERTLRVLVTAPRALRLERTAKTQNLASDEARRRLEREEEARRDFHRHHFDVDPDDASHYDLVVNTGSLGIELASQLVVEAWMGRFAPGS